MTLEIATQVLMAASALDHRVEPSTETIAMWAKCFEGKRVWPREAINAVADHYSKPNPFPPMPGDIIEFCRKQPVWSSREHLRFHLEYCAEDPLGGGIERATGIIPPPHQYPLDMRWSEEKALRTERLKKWIAENEDTLYGAALSRKTPPPALES